MLTKKDKAYIEGLIEEKLDRKLASFVTKDEFSNTISELRNDFITRFDQVMGELKLIREEITVFGYRQREHSDQLEDHQKRIVEVEKVCFSSG